MDLKITRVERQQRRNMATGGMAADEQTIGVAAELADVTNRPGQCGGGVFCLSRPRILRGEPITGDDCEDPFLGEALAEGRVQSAIAETPGAAMNEKEDRRMLGFLRDIQVQLMFGLVVRLAIRVNEI